MQWKSDLIGYDALNSYGSPSYYVQKMFSGHHGDEVLMVDSENIPTRPSQAPPPRNNLGQTNATTKPVPTLFFNATRDSQTGIIYLKVVNSLDTPQPVKIEISGTSAIEAEGETLVLKANSPNDTNSIQEPIKIVPITGIIDGLGTDFTREFPPYSITILELKTK